MLTVDKDTSILFPVRKNPKVDTNVASRLNRHLSKFFGDESSFSPAQTELYRRFSSLVKDCERGKSDIKVRKEATSRVLGLSRELHATRRSVAFFCTALWTVLQAVDRKTIKEAGDLLVEIVNHTERGSLPRKRLSAFVRHHGRDGVLRNRRGFTVSISCDAGGKWKLIINDQEPSGKTPFRELVDWFSR